MINVIVVEDNDTIREGLKILIDSTKEFSCLAAFPDCEILLQTLPRLNPDILLIDIGLPGMNGIEGIKKVKTLSPGLTILVLTVYEENDLIFNALCAGANGYIAKKTPPSKLLNAIKEAYDGYTPMNSKIAGKVIKLFAGNNNDSDNAGLTENQKEILEKLAEGSSVKAVADSLSISKDKIGMEFRSIYNKLHQYSRVKVSGKMIFLK